MHTVMVMVVVIKSHGNGPVDSVDSILLSMRKSNSNTGLCRKTPLLRRRPMGRQAFKAPSQGLEGSLCSWIAGQELAQQKYYLCADTGTGCLPL